MPVYAAQVGGAKQTFAAGLEDIYKSLDSPIERNVPAFDAIQYTDKATVAEAFSQMPAFSPLGLLATLLLGALGLLKYFLAEKSRVVYVAKGGDDNIEKGGGFRI